MKSFRQFLKEMPVTRSVDRQHIYNPRQGVKATPKGKTLFTRKDKNPGPFAREKLGRGTDTHDFYTHTYGHPHERERLGSRFHELVATDKSGKEQYRIQGNGDSKKKTFKASFAQSSPDRTMKYHEMITHLVTNGHIKQWKSDRIHSRGSVETYRKLAAHPGLKVTHHYQGVFGERQKRVTAGNVDSFYGKEGHFTITKK